MLIIVTPPENDPVSADEAKANLLYEDNEQDDFIAGLIASATQKLDGRDGLLGRCLLTQTWKLVLDGFPAMGTSGEIVIPLPPCQSVDSIEYIDAAGATQTLAPENYQVAGLGSPDGVRVAAAFGKSWPSTRSVLENVTVTFTAGYGDDPEDVPAPIREAIKQHVAHLFQNRESVLVGDGISAIELPQGAVDLLTNFRTYGF